MLLAFDLPTLCYESPMYLYVFLFHQINLNGKGSDVSAIFVRFQFSVFTYWCIRTYHVAYCIR